jgi:hypothetical protein
MVTRRIVLLPSTGIFDDRAVAPRRVELLQNTPNPFATVTNIRFFLDKPEKAALKAYAITGEEVSVLFEGSLPAGEKFVAFDGAGLPRGIYYYELTVAGSRQQKKMLLLR